MVQKSSMTTWPLRSAWCLNEVFLGYVKLISDASFPVKANALGFLRFLFLARLGLVAFGWHRIERTAGR